MLKNILKISLIGFFISSCSGTDEQIADLAPIEPEIVNDENLTKLALKITADKTEGNIFESFQFKLNQNDQSESFGNLQQHLDSLVFKVSDNKNTKKIFEKTPNGYASTTTFNHNFYLPGTYDSSILGYKNGKIIYKDHISVKVADKNDFLAINWTNFPTSINSIGYHNAVGQNTLSFYSSFENNNQFVILMNYWNNMQNYTSDQINQRDKDFLYNYLLKFYSTPQYSEANTSNLKDIFIQKFKKNILNDIPVNIWITSKNKIALMKEYSKTDPTKFYGYRVIAEPNN